MVEDPITGEEFDSKEEMHLNWAENHMDELNSHQKEKAKKAKRKKEEEKQQLTQERKQKAFKGLGAVLAVVVIGVLGTQAYDIYQASTQTGDIQLDLEDQPMLGDEDAPVTVVEFGDFQCPACLSFETGTKPPLQSNYIETGIVQFYYVNLPVTGNAANLAAMAAECVYQQDEEEYWGFHNALFDNLEAIRSGAVGLEPESMRDLAESSTTGLDYDQFEQCYDNQETAQDVQNDRQMAQDNFRRLSTPTLVVNNELVTDGYGYQTLSAVIDEAHEEAQQQEETGEQVEG